MTFADSAYQTHLQERMAQPLPMMQACLLVYPTLIDPAGILLDLLLSIKTCLFMLVLLERLIYLSCSFV